MDGLIGCCAFDVGFGRVPRWTASKIFTTLLFIALAGTTLLFSLYGGTMIQTPEYKDVVCDLSGYRFYVVYKMGLAIALYHGVLAMFLAGVQSDEDPRSIIQDAFWPAKLLVLGGSFAGTMWIPRWMLDKMFYPVVILALLFMAAQSLIMVDVSYSITGFCLDNGGGLMSILIISSLLLYGLIGYGSFSLWQLFSDETERLIIMVSVVLTVALAVLSVLPAVRRGNERSGLFQASVIGTLSLAIIGSAIVFSPQHQIVASAGTNQLLKVMTIIVHVLSGIFAFISIMATSYLGSSGGKGSEAHSYNYSLFHVTFMIVAMYMIATLTGWQQPVATGSSLAFVDNGLSFWAKIGVAGIINAFYAWTLFAPLVFPDREFDF